MGNKNFFQVLESESSFFLSTDWNCVQNQKKLSVYISILQCLLGIRTSLPSLLNHHWLQQPLLILHIHCFSKLSIHLSSYYICNFPLPRFSFFTILCMISKFSERERGLFWRLLSDFMMHEYVWLYKLSHSSHLCHRQMFL